MPIMVTQSRLGWGYGQASLTYDLRKGHAMQVLARFYLLWSNKGGKKAENASWCVSCALAPVVIVVVVVVVVV